MDHLQRSTTKIVIEIGTIPDTGRRRIGVVGLTVSEGVCLEEVEPRAGRRSVFLGNFLCGGLGGIGVLLRLR